MRWSMFWRKPIQSFMSFTLARLKICEPKKQLELKKVLTARLKSQLSEG